MEDAELSEIEAAVAALRDGKLIVLPTDTVYGLGAALDEETAIAAIFAVKGRPEGRPLPVLGADRTALEEVARFDASARRVADRYWPGPLTLVLPRALSFVTDLGLGVDSSVGVRVPGSERALELLRLTGPLVVTSANRSGEPPPANIAEARASLGDAVAFYLDAGPVTGVESTVLSLIGEATVLREGALPAAEVLQLATS